MRGHAVQKPLLRPWRVFFWRVFAIVMFSMALPYSAAVSQSVTPPRHPTAAKASVDPSALFAMFRSARSVPSGKSFFKDATFVGSEACKGCHAAAYEDWRATWHARMEQWPTAETVLGDFDDKIITYRGVEVADRNGKTVKLTFQVRAHRDADGFYFTVLDQDDAVNNQTFKIAKTLGGKWDQGYEIKIGERYFPAILRYSVKQRGWLVATFNPEFWVTADGTADGRPVKESELPMGRVAEAKCAGCHTTGFTFGKDPGSGHWTAYGNGELGVGCEKCHGPGSAHVRAAETAQREGRPLAADQLHIVHGLKDLDHVQQTQLCAQCHGRSTNRQTPDLSFPTGFLPGDADITEHLVFWSYQATTNPNQTKYFYRNDWAKRNRQQWQDFTKSTHFKKAGMSCQTCHSFHGKTQDAQLRQTATEQCAGCHGADKAALRPQQEFYRGSKMEDAGVRCIDCHMARIGFRSHLIEEAGGGKSKSYPMDGSSHHFQVATPETKRTFGTRTACESCHTKGRALPPQIYEWVMAHPMTDDELDAKLRGTQSRVRGLIGDTMAALNALPSRLSTSNRNKVNTARSNVDVVKLDGSLGFHNPAKAEAMLLEALELLKDAGSAPAEARLAALAASRADASSPGGTTRQAQSAPAVAGYAKLTAAPAAGSTSPLAGAAPSPTAPVPSDIGQPAAGSAKLGQSTALDAPKPGGWYVSRTGDTLWGLAARIYGSGAKYERIYAANTSRMSSADYLPPGTRIWLPD